MANKGVWGSPSRLASAAIPLSALRDDAYDGQTNRMHRLFLGDWIPDLALQS